jgi:Helix-turn-helix domain
MAGSGPKRDETGIFVRLPVAHARLLDRAAAAVPARKKDLIAGLLAQHVDPDTPEGLERLRELAPRAPAASRRIVIEEERGLQRGSAGFNPFPPPEVLDADGAAELLAVEPATVIELAEKGEIPGRLIASQWRFARQGLLDWLSRSEAGPPVAPADEGGAR